MREWRERERVLRKKKKEVKLNPHHKNHRWPFIIK